MNSLMMKIWCEVMVMKRYLLNITADTLIKETGLGIRIIAACIVKNISVKCLDV